MLINVIMAVIGAFFSAFVLAVATYAFVEGMPTMGAWFVVLSVLLAGNHWLVFLENCKP